MPAGASRSLVLVLEDDQGLRIAMDRVLAIAGFETYSYDRGEALLESPRSSQACCLVLDVKLPGMSGFEVREKLTAAGVRVPIVFMTSYDESVTRRRAVALGASAYLTKPFLGSTLIEAVRNAIHAPHAHLTA